MANQPPNGTVKGISHLASAMSRPMDSTIEQSNLDPAQFYGQTNKATLGPGLPPAPFPLGGDPRQWQYRIGWNLPTEPGEGRVDAQTLLQLADSYDLLRRCIEIRKYELVALEWDIVPRERNNRKKVKAIHDKHADLIDQIKQVFTYPEAYMRQSGKQWQRQGIRTWDEWLNGLLEDYFVLDAMTIYPRPKLNGELLALERVDGSTIKPMLSIDGRTPIPPAPAYQQYLYGIPRASFTLNDLYYKPRNLRNRSPYGYSHVEQALILINWALRMQLWYSAYFTDGSIPEGLLETPEGWTPDQIWDFIDQLNTRLAGNPKALRQFMPAPAGGKWLPIKAFEFNEGLQDYIVTMTCALLDVMPIELGFMPRHGSGLGGKGFSEEQTATHHRKSLVPTAKWLESIFTQIIHQWYGQYGADELEFSFIELRDVEDTERDNADINLVKTGIKSLDEVITERGGQPIGVGRIFVVGPNQILFEPDLIKGSQEGAAAIISPTPEQPSKQSQEPPKEELMAKPDDKPQEADTKKAASTDSTDSTRTQEQGSQIQQELTAALVAMFAAWIARARLNLDAGTLGGVLPVSSVAAQIFTPNDSQIKDLGTAIYEHTTKAYEQGIQDQLNALGIDEKAKLTLVEVDQALKQAAQDAAQEIGQTYGQDIENELAKLIDDGLEGTDLIDALHEWASERAGWKASSIATTELSAPYNRGVFDFAIRNGICQMMYWVKPETAVCAKCKELVDNSPYYGADAREFLSGAIPVHPNCVHYVEAEYPGDSATNLDMNNIWKG